MVSKAVASLDAWLEHAEEVLWEQRLLDQNVVPSNMEVRHIQPSSGTAERA